MATEQVKEISSRLGKVGGQAVLEGVMMRSGTAVALAVRQPDGGIVLDRSEFVSARKKHRALNFPILRGIVNFVEMLKLSYGTLMKSADLLGLEDELAAAPEGGETTAEDDEKRRKKAERAVKITEVVSLVLGFALAVGLFVVLPVYVAKLINYLTPGVDLDSLFAVTSLIEGAVRIVLFIGYMLLMTLLPDMRRTFEYHGAEHKSVFCYEYGWDMTPENARRCTRFHPRCGTSFIFVILLISILIGAFIPGSLPKLARIGCKLLLVPLIVGISYEFIMYAGKHDNAFVRIVSAPGLWMQRITTKEPSDDQIKVAIAALKAAIPDDFPEMVGVDALDADGKPVQPAADEEKTDGEEPTGGTETE